jgi:hypothetical protein
MREVRRVRRGQQGARGASGARKRKGIQSGLDGRLVQGGAIAPAIPLLAPFALIAPLAPVAPVAPYTRLVSLLVPPAAGMYAFST